MERTEIQVIMRSAKKGYLAYGLFDGSGLTVLKGSKVCEDVRSSYRDSQALTRANYIGADGITLKDLYFKSPSAASNFVCGRSANGWVEWVTPDGIKLGAFRGQDLKKSELLPAVSLQPENKPKSIKTDETPDLKQKIEQLLLELTKQDEDVQIIPRSIHTSIYYKGSLIASVYYRVREIRVELRDSQPTHTLYEELQKESVVYQKPSADPWGVSGKYSFFVSADDAETVLVAIIIAAQEGKLIQSGSKLPAVKPEQIKVKNEPVSEAHPDHEEREVPVQRIPQPKPPESNHRLEKKLDSLIQAIATMYTEKPSEVEQQPEPEMVIDHRFKIEPIQLDAPILLPKKKTTITGLIAPIRLIAVGAESARGEYRLFFIDSNHTCVSNEAALSAISGEEYTCRFELKTSVCEENTIYLAIRSADAAEDTVAQLFAYPVKIAFGTDFGL